MNIEGIPYNKQTITKTCVYNRTAPGAFEEAASRIEKSYLDIVQGSRWDQAREPVVKLILVVEWEPAAGGGGARDG